MTWQAWLTLAVVVATVAVLVRDRLAPSAVVLGAVILLLAGGVLTPQLAFSGFSNPAPITVAALYVLARAIEKTGALQPLVTAVLGDGKGHRRSLAKLLLPSAGASAFLNNTPIVAMLVPQVTEWAEQHGRSPSRYLMPLAYAVSLGGVVTVIGTSTNIVVSGLLEAAGQRPIAMFELTCVGGPIAILGIGLLLVLAPLVLPDRRSIRRELAESVREFVVQMKVVSGGPLDGEAAEAGGLRHLQGVFLVEVARQGQLIAPVAPTLVLRGGDRLTFVGKADQVVDLQNIRGLVSSEEPHFAGFDTTRHTFFEAVVGAASPLVGKTLKEAGFRSRYQAAVVAIHRAGQLVNAKLGEVRLKVGDTLLLLADPGFRDRWRDRNDFLLVSRMGGTPPQRTRNAGVVGLIMLGVVVIAGVGILPILQAALLAAVGLVALGVLTPGEARDAIDLDVIVLIAASFGLGAAIQSSGLADRLAALLVGGFSRWGPPGALLGLVLATLLLTELLTNNTAAILAFPLGLSTATQLGLETRPFAIAIAFAASMSFLTPIGYQTNMMVYGPGGYRFADYSRLGAPLTLLAIIAIVVGIPLFWPLQP